MNKLDVKISNSNDGKRQALLLVDNKPITSFYNKKNIGLPVWLMDNGEFPKMSSHFDDMIINHDPQEYIWSDDYRIISICNCGLLSCGNGYCRITVTERSVIFDNFGKDREISNLGLSFEFSRKNYDEVMSKIS